MSFVSASSQYAFDFGSSAPIARLPRRPARHSSQRWQPEKDTVYFAVLPDRETADHIARFSGEFRREHQIAGSCRPASALHISQVPLGLYRDLDDDIASLACRAASMLRSRPFDVTLDRVETFGGGGNRALVLRTRDGETKLVRLHEALRHAFEKVGLSRFSQGQFTPHLTFLYGDLPVPQTRLDNPIAWTVKSFVLVRSLYGLSRLEILGRWPLRG
jgi:2'-5' RNA ligase